MRPYRLVTLLAGLALASALGCVVPVAPVHPEQAAHPHGGPPGLAHHPHGGPPGQLKKARVEAEDALVLEHRDPLILVVVSPRLGFDCWRHGDHYHCKR